MCLRNKDAPGCNVVISNHMTTETLDSALYYVGGTELTSNGWTI